MVAKLPDQTGAIYGFLKVTKDLGRKPVKNGKQNAKFVLCTCQNCGLEGKEFILADLRSGKTLSCGCVKKSSLNRGNRSHSMSRTRPYRIWKNIKDRCLNPKNPSWKYYGGRGITICSEWITFEGFWLDMKSSYLENLEIDRIDVNKGYSKENCRWTTGSQNSFNQKTKVTNKTGVTGVVKDTKPGSFRAQIGFHVRQIYLGVFDDFETAVKIRKKAEIEYFGFNKSV